MDSARDDEDLLQRYAEHRDEVAFAQLVQRHIDRVYAVALRQVGRDSHLAEDVTQRVFSDLARKARELSHRPSLGGWLNRSAHFAAADVVRSERRRRMREQTAETMRELTDEMARHEDWNRVWPVLDEALNDLDDDDRDAVWLRHVEGRSYAEVGARLQLAENAARMRVERSLDKLHAALAKRGITSTISALSVALAKPLVAVAPAGLAATVASVATTAGAGAAGSGLLALVSLEKLLLSLGGVAVVSLGGAWHFAQRADGSRSAFVAAKSAEAVLIARTSDLEYGLRAATGRLQVAEETNSRLLAEAENLKNAVTKNQEESITSGMVSARFKRAQELMNAGSQAEALRELLWCYDVGMPHVRGMSAVRVTSLELFRKLGETYLPARESLLQRRERLREKVLASESDYEVVREFSAVNRALQDHAANIALFDSLPPGDRRRRALAGSSFEYLVELQRYRDAAEGRPLGLINAEFERIVADVSDSRRTPEHLQQSREYLLKRTLLHIEMLAGANDVLQALALAQRLLAFDPAETTRILIQKHAARGGQPALLAVPSPP